MYRYKAWTVLVLMGFINMIVAQEDIAVSWQTYSDDGGEFSIRVPMEPEYLSKVIMTSIGELEVHSFMMAPKYVQEDANLMYLLEYIDYPEGVFHQDSTELKQLFYEQTARSTSIDIGGKLVYQSPTKVGNYEASLYRCQYKDDTYVMKSKMFFVGDRFFHLKVYSAKEESLNDDMDYFLNSWKRKTY